MIDPMDVVFVSFCEEHPSEPVNGELLDIYQHDISQTGDGSMVAMSVFGWWYGYNASGDGFGGGGHRQGTTPSYKRYGRYSEKGWKV